jgi:hypothetical protein
MNYVGIDRHHHYSHLTVINQQGRRLRSGRVANLQSEIERFLEGWEALEAVIVFLAQRKEEVREEVARETNRLSVKRRRMLLELDPAKKEKRLPDALLKTYRRLGTRIEESAAPVYSSGDRTHHGKIVRVGNRWPRWAAVEADWPAIRAGFDLRCFYERPARNKGANKAKVAAARRLLTIIDKGTPTISPP